MRILPVIDLKSGVVVRGVGGHRDTYQPVQSCFVDNARPESVARGLRDQFDFRQAYVADLDAIRGAEPQWAAIDSIIHAGLRLWLDTGIRDRFDAARVAQHLHQPRTIDSMVIGLETLRASSDLPDLLEMTGADQTVFSLDLRLGRPMTKEDSWPKLDALTIARQVVEMGVKRLMILDLAGIGVEGGVTTLRLCRTLRRDFPSLELTSGGGIRDRADVAALAEAGCNFAMVATALHSGALRSADLQDYNTV